MAAFRDLYALKFTVHVGYLDIEAYISENYTDSKKEGISLPHNHHNYELRYVEDGTCERVVEGKSFVSHSGDCLIIPPMCYHYYNQNENTTTSECGMRFALKSHAKTNSHAEIAYKKAVSLFSKPIILHDKVGRIPLYLSLIRSEVYEKRIGYINAVQSYSALIFTEIFRMADADMSTLFPPDELIFHGRDYMMLDRFFTESASNPNITVAECAKAMQLSTRHTDRTIYKLYGMSFYEKLKEVRLKRAAHLLKCSDKPVGEISIECGFGSYSAFHACFRREYNMSPTEFRNDPDITF